MGHPSAPTERQRRQVSLRSMKRRKRACHWTTTRMKEPMLTSMTLVLFLSVFVVHSVNGFATNLVFTSSGCMTELDTSEVIMNYVVKSHEESDYPNMHLGVVVNQEKGIVDKESPYYYDPKHGEEEDAESILIAFVNPYSQEEFPDASRMEFVMDVVVEYLEDGSTSSPAAQFVGGGGVGCDKNKRLASKFVNGNEVELKILDRTADITIVAGWSTGHEAVRLLPPLLLKPKQEEEDNIIAIEAEVAAEADQEARKQEEGNAEEEFVEAEDADADADAEQEELLAQATAQRAAEEEAEAQAESLAQATAQQRAAEEEAAEQAAAQQRAAEEQAAEQAAAQPRADEEQAAAQAAAANEANQAGERQLENPADAEINTERKEYNETKEAAEPEDRAKVSREAVKEIVKNLWENNNKKEKDSKRKKNEKNNEEQQPQDADKVYIRNKEDLIKYFQEQNRARAAQNGKNKFRGVMDGAEEEPNPSSKDMEFAPLGDRRKSHLLLDKDHHSNQHEIEIDNSNYHHHFYHSSESKEGTLGNDFESLRALYESEDFASSLSMNGFYYGCAFFVLSIGSILVGLSRRREKGRRDL